MGWTSPKTWVDEELVSAALLNTHLRDNLAYLLPKTIGRQGYFIPSPISTTSTSFVDADATNLKVTGQLAGSALWALVGPIICLGNAGYAHPYLDLILDSTTRAGNSSGGLWRAYATNVGETAFLMGFWSGLSPGTHDVKLQIKSSNGSYAVNIGNMTYVNMILVEA